MMDYSAMQIYKKTPRPLGLCRPTKRAPNWLLTTKRQLVKGLMIPSISYVKKNVGTHKEQMDYSLSGWALSVLTKEEYLVLPS